MNETIINSAHQRRNSFVIIGLILSAWVILVIWSLSPYAGLLDHHTIGEGDLPLIVRLGLFLIGWFLMVMAMMLPASFLTGDNFFRQSVRQDWWAYSPAYMLGYLALWIAFGGFIYLGDAGLHEGVEHFAVLETLSVGIFWALLLIIGGYQFTSAKHICLSKDHLPLHTQERAHSNPVDGLARFRMGSRHGLYCLGSCWGLMLLMFAIGSMNLIVMLGLSGIMIAERVAPIRWQFSRLVGLCLIALAFMIMFSKLSSFQV